MGKEKSKGDFKDIEREKIIRNVLNNCVSVGNN